jgi:hypothetical protein
LSKESIDNLKESVKLIGMVLVLAEYLDSGKPVEEIPTVYLQELIARLTDELSNRNEEGIIH